VDTKVFTLQVEDKPTHVDVDNSMSIYLLAKKREPKKVRWQKPQEKAYTSLKTMLTSAPILKLPDVHKPYKEISGICGKVQNCSRITTIADCRNDQPKKLQPFTYVQHGTCPKTISNLD